MEKETITVFRTDCENLFLISMPGNDRDEIRYKGRDLTFQDGGVAPDGVLFVDVRFVHLGDDQKGNGTERDVYNTKTTTIKTD